MIGTCLSCTFFKTILVAVGEKSPSGAPSQEGECWRYPPTLLATPRGMMSAYPPTRKNLGCGEYLPTIKS